MGREFNRNKDSIHWLLFSGLSISNNPKRILEIGTFDGHFTFILSKLFPKSNIITLDLPESDPLIRETYNRTSDEDYINYVSDRKDNTKASNIRFIDRNSLFLLDSISGKFDIIWIDGGHHFPEIAWDISNSYHLLNEGGIMLCDDIIISNTDMKKGYVSSDSYKTLKYLEQRTKSKMFYFLKRFDGKRYATTINRKYVSYFKKE